MGVHGCGVGVVDGTSESVEDPPRGRKGMSIMPERAWEDMYPQFLCVSGDVHEGSSSAREACVLIVDSVHARVLRVVY